MRFLALTPLALVLAQVVAATPAPTARATAQPSEKPPARGVLRVIGAGGAAGEGSSFTDTGLVDGLAEGSEAPADAPSPRAPGGTLAGRPFTPTAVVLTDDLDGVHRLHLLEGVGPTDCGAILPSPRARGLVLAACGPVCPDGRHFGSTPATPATGARARYVGLPSTAPDGARLELTLDGLDTARRRARGRLSYRAGDGSAVEGEFVALTCVSKQRRRAAPAPLHGLDWGRAPVAADALPDEPLAAVLAGHPFTPAAVRLVPRGYEPGWELVFYADAGARPCDPPETRLAGPTATDGLVIRLAEDQLAPGTVVRSRSYLAGPRDRGTTVLLFWDEPELGAAAVHSENRNLTLAIDAVDRTAGTVRGRIYLAFEDGGRSFFVGAFTAALCP